MESSMTRRGFLQAFGAAATTMLVPGCATDITNPKLLTEELRSLLKETHLALSVVDCEGIKHDRRAGLEITMGNIRYNIDRVLESPDDTALALFHEISSPYGEHPIKKTIPETLTLGTGFVSSFLTERGYHAYNFHPQHLVQITHDNLYICPIVAQDNQYARYYNMPLNGNPPEYALVQFEYEDQWRFKIKPANNLGATPFAPTEALPLWETTEYNQLMEQVEKYYSDEVIKN